MIEICQHPKLGTCKNCGCTWNDHSEHFAQISLQEIRKEIICKDHKCAKYDGITQSDIDKYHAEMLRRVNDFGDLEEWANYSKPILETARRCLNGE